MTIVYVLIGVLVVFFHALFIGAFTAAFLNELKGMFFKHKTLTEVSEVSEKSVRLQCADGFVVHADPLILKCVNGKFEVVEK